MSTPATKPAPQTGAYLLVKSLETQGVEYIFGIPGAKIDKVFDTLVDSKIQTMQFVHHAIVVGIVLKPASGVDRAEPLQPENPERSCHSRPHATLLRSIMRGHTNASRTQACLGQLC